MHFPRFNSLIAALVLLGMVTAAPVPQEDGVDINAVLLNVPLSVDFGPF